MLAGVAAHVHALHGDAEGGGAQLTQDQVPVGNVLVRRDPQRRVRRAAAQLRRVEDGQQEEVHAAVVRVEHGGNDVLVADAVQALLHEGGLDVQTGRFRRLVEELRIGGRGCGGQLALDGRCGRQLALNATLHDPMKTKPFRIGRDWLLIVRLLFGRKDVVRVGEQRRVRGPRIGHIGDGKVRHVATHGVVLLLSELLLQLLPIEEIGLELILDGEVRVFVRTQVGSRLVVVGGIL